MPRKNDINSITKKLEVISQRAAEGDEAMRLELDVLSSRGLVTAADLDAATDEQLADLLASLEAIGA